MRRALAAARPTMQAMLRARSEPTPPTTIAAADIPGFLSTAVHVGERTRATSSTSIRCSSACSASWSRCRAANSATCRAASTAAASGDRGPARQHRLRDGADGRPASSAGRARRRLPSRPRSDDGDPSWSPAATALHQGDDAVPGKAAIKVGAEGVYCGALPQHRRHLPQGDGRRVSGAEVIMGQVLAIRRDR